MSDIWETIKETYVNSGGTLKLKDLANEFDVKYSTLRSKKNREEWDKLLNDNNLRAKKVRTETETAKKKKDAYEIIDRKDIKKIVNKQVKIQESNPSLTEKQALFCMYYVQEWNATKAYMKSYGTDYTTSQRLGPRLLRTEVVKKEVTRLKKAIRETILIEPLAILKEYADIAFSDMGDYAQWGSTEVLELDPTGSPIKGSDGEFITRKVNYVELKDSRKVNTRLVSEIKQGRDGVSVKMIDKMKALEKLEKYFDVIYDGFDRSFKVQRLELEKEKLEILKKKVDTEEIEEEVGVVMLPEVEEWGDGEDGDNLETATETS